MSDKRIDELIAERNANVRAGVAPAVVRDVVPVATTPIESQSSTVTSTPSGTEAVAVVPVKPGWKTSEFWITIGAQVLPILVKAFGYPDAAAELSKGGIAALVAYVISRGIAKHGK